MEHVRLSEAKMGSKDVGMVERAQGRAELNPFGDSVVPTLPAVGCASGRLGTAWGVSLLYLVPVKGDNLVLRAEAGPDGAESCPSPSRCALFARSADSQVHPPGASRAAAAPAGTSQLKTHTEGSDSLKATQ